MDIPLPHDDRAEREMLGMMCMGKHVADSAAVELPDGASEFFSERHRRFYAAIMAIYASGADVDDVTIEQALRETIPGGTTDELVRYLQDLFHSRGTIPNVPHYARIIHGCYVKRQLISAANAAIEDGFNEKVTPSDACQRISARLDGVNELASHTAAGGQSLEEAVESAFERLSNPVDKSQWLPTGFTELDKIIIGLGPAQLTVVGARASRGKTAFALNIADHVGVVCRIPTLFFSLEMPPADIAARAILSRAGASEYELRDKQHDFALMERVAQARDDVKESALHFRGGEHSLDDIVNVSRVMHRKAGIKLVIIDYLSLIEVDGTFERYDLRIGHTTRRLKKRVAEALGVHVLLLAQLNRKHESEERPPRMSDFRDSDMIAHDADKIILPWQPPKKTGDGYAKQDEEPQKRFESGRAFLIVDKHRNGKTGTAQVYWRAECTRFEDYAEQDVYIQR